METVLVGIKNFLSLINDNWTLIIIIIGLILMLKKKIQSFLKMSEEEKIDATLSVIKKELLKLMADAEIYWEEYVKSGELKKSQVINKIYEKYPFLATYIDQDSLIKRIEDMIEDEMGNLNEIINGIQKLSNSNDADVWED